MKLLAPILRFRKRSKQLRKVSDHKEEALLQVGSEQFKALAKKGLSVPVALL